MSKPLLVPLDGSPLAEHALTHATAFGLALDAPVILFYAQWPVLSAADGPDLESIAAPLREAGVAVQTETVLLSSPGEAGQAILLAADRLDVAAIVMATHGRGGLGRLIYGSVADHVLRHATVPVLLARPAAERAWPRDRPPRVLVPLDGSETAEAILTTIQDVVRPTGAELILLWVVETLDYVKPHGDDCEVCRRARAMGNEPDIGPVRAKRYLEGIAERLRKSGLRVDAQTEIGHAAGTIARIAGDRDVDLIAMSTRGHSGLSRAVMGSVANETLRLATVPLLLVRP